MTRSFRLEVTPISIAALALASAALWVVVIPLEVVMFSGLSGI